MESAFLIGVALLPLGLVLVSAYLLIKRKTTKTKLKLVSKPLSQEVVEAAAKQAAKTQGAPERGSVVIPLKKRVNKRKPKRGGKR